jgi:uncharacterized protein YbjT (DUF2867 family)
MHIILGGTGRVGSALADALIARGEPVTVVTHSPARASEIRKRGAEPAVADVHDVDATRAIFKRGKRAFLLNPPAPPDTNTDVEERATVAAIVAALSASGLEKVVAESTYGAQPVERAGDLGVLYEMEQALRAQPIPASVVRGAYYMSNWDAAFDTARNEGVVHTLYPVEFRIPMVAPQDLGRFAAKLMLEPIGAPGTHYVEGPARYSSADVATAFAAALGKPVKAVSTPRDRWVESFRSLGFSEPAADSYARMTAITLDGGFPALSEARRGEVTLQTYVNELVNRSSRPRTQRIAL